VYCDQELNPILHSINFWKKIYKIVSFEIDIPTYFKAKKALQLTLLKISMFLIGIKYI